MRLLVTRAAEDAARTKARLVAAGHTVLLSPVIRFQSLMGAWPERAPDGVIATSARAFSCEPNPGRRPLGWTQPSDTPSPSLQSVGASDRTQKPAMFASDAPGRDYAVDAVPLFLVGRRTQEAARQAGFYGPATVAPDAAALAAILRADKAMRLLYLAGVDRTFDIEDALADSKHRLMVMETYCAEATAALTPEALAALAADTLDGVLHYSRRSAMLFLGLCAGAGIDATSIAHVCLSKDVAAPCQAAGCRAVTIAATPTEDGLMAVIAEMTMRVPPPAPGGGGSLR